MDVRFCFAEGDQVLRLARRDSKLSPRAWGPYIFVRYSPSRTTANIRDASTGKEINVSVAHLRPMLPERAQRMYRYPPAVTSPGTPPSHSSEDPTTDRRSA